MNPADAFDAWRAAEPAALHNLTIAEVFAAGWDRGRVYERDLAAPAAPADDPREPCEEDHGLRGCCHTAQRGPHMRKCPLTRSAQEAMGNHERMFRHVTEIPTQGE